MCIFWAIWHQLSTRWPFQPGIRRAEPGVMNPWGSNNSINDQGDGPQCTLSKFADDMKLRVLHKPNGCAAIQKELKRLEKGDDRSMLKFSKGKWPVSLLGRSNPRHPSMLGAHCLESSSAETKSTAVCAPVAKKASCLMGWRSITWRLKEQTLFLFWALLNLDCWVWALQYKRGKDTPFPVQESAVKIIKGLENLSLRAGTVHPMEEIFRGILYIDKNTWRRSKDDGGRIFSLELSKTMRGDAPKLKFRKFHLNLRKSFFFFYHESDQRPK